jgi:hypothetical protein
MDAPFNNEKNTHFFLRKENLRDSESQIAAVKYLARNIKYYAAKC